MENTGARSPHDIGGVSAFLCLPVDTGPHELTPFDKEVDALRQILGAKGVMSVDELRRGIEALPEAEYFQLTYYQKWLRSIVATLVGKGVVSEAELREALERP
jgi:hypothetical protein